MSLLGTILVPFAPPEFYDQTGIPAELKSEAEAVPCGLRDYRSSGHCCVRSCGVYRLRPAGWASGTADRWRYFVATFAAPLLVAPASRGACDSDWRERGREPVANQRTGRHQKAAWT